MCCRTAAWASTSRAWLRRGTIDPWPEPVIQFADLAFPTPSGKIEIASARAAADGHPVLPEARADARPTPGCLRLLSPASRWQMNDSYGNDPKIQDKLGAASVAINPADATALGVRAGDRVEMSNDYGRLILVAVVDDVVPPGVALSHKGRWPGCEADGANVNLLNPGVKSDMGESSAVHGVEVRIAPAG